MATLKKGKIILEPNEASKLLALIHLTKAKRSSDIAPLRGLEDFEKKTLQLKFNRIRGHQGKNNKNHGFSRQE